MLLRGIFNIRALCFGCAFMIHYRSALNYRILRLEKIFDIELSRCTFDVLNA